MPNRSVVNNMGKLKICALTEIGLVRKKNQDNFYVDGIYKEELNQDNFGYSKQIALKEKTVCAVFDGMGGLSFGEEAAYAAASGFDAYLACIEKEGQKFDGVKALEYLNTKVCELKRKKNVEMGSTATVLYYENETVQVCNIGDSKAFLIRDGEMIQISEDHNEANSLKKIQHSLGIKVERENTNLLTQFLGIEEDEFLIEPALSDLIQLKEKDIILLCSDGLTGMVSEQDMIETVIFKESTLEDKTKELYQKALQAGGRDNITIILLSVER